VNRGELLTRLTIWLALGAYAIGAAMMLRTRAGAQSMTYARCAWTIGCALFIAHVVCAFSYYHRLSHAAAFHETARRTAELTGLHWGWGLFLNYLFGAAWIADVLWWWIAPDHFARRPPVITIIWQAFAFFMVFNGTVVFGASPVRWFGLLTCASLAALWLKRPRFQSPGARR